MKQIYRRGSFVSTLSSPRKAKIQFLKWVGILSIGVTFVMSGAAVQAQLTKLTIGNNTLSTNGLPAWMAKEARIFGRNGLDVQIVYFRGGTITTMALIARETPISQVSGPPIVSAALKGADAVMVAAGNVVSEYWLMRIECREGCHPRADRHDPGAPECAGDGKSSSRHAQRTRQLQGAEKRAV